MKLLTEIEFQGKKFPVPDNAEEFEVTHMVMGVHSLRGAMCLRLMKKHSDPEARRKEILQSIFNLYGSTIDGVKFIPIYAEPAKRKAA